MHSALYTGRLRHRRFAPRPHAFAYPVCLAWIDLSEVDRVFEGRWLWSARRPTLAWLRRADYLGSAHRPLDEAVRDRVENETGRRPQGPIRLLTHLRMFGHCFNPVSFYYCYDAEGEQVETIVAEITNTPWNERHAYVLRAGGGPDARAGVDASAGLDTGFGPDAGAGPSAQQAPLRFRFGKSFHVSPFMPMEIDYDWRFTAPAGSLVVHMVNRHEGERIFDATMTLERREITGPNLALALARFPFATMRVVGAIYWQALRLWLKRVPFHPHPDSRIEERTT